MCYKCPWVQKFNSVSVYDQTFLSYRPFWDKCTQSENPPNDPKCYKVKYTPYVLLVLTRPKFHPFRSKTRCCWVTCHFEKSAPNDPKMTLNPTRSNVPNTCVTSIREAKISLFRSTTSRFRVTDHFETSAQNDPKMTLNTTSSNVAICVNSVPDSQISFRFALWPAVCEI